MAYYSGKGARYDRAVTKKIIQRSTAKNRAIQKALEAETDLNRAKWEQILSELAGMESASEREKRALNLFLTWQLEKKEVKEAAPKKQAVKKPAPRNLSNPDWLP